MTYRRLLRGKSSERGAAAVELALLLPLLLLLVFGIIDFGRALNAQITITQAAREGARVASLGGTQAQIQTRVNAAAVGLTGVTVPPVTPCPANAAGGVDATVQVNYTITFVTPLNAISRLFGGSGVPLSLNLSSTGVMPCET